MANHNLIQYNIFHPFTNLVAFTTRKNTLGNGLLKFTGNDPEMFRKYRQQLANILGIGLNQLVFPRQTHTGNVAEISNIPDNEPENTDALITNKPGICLCIQTADCAPVLLYDSQRDVIAAVHAGWRGTVLKIAENTILEMKNKFGSAPKNIHALIGPSISSEIYEVGEEVVKAVHENIPHAETSIRQYPGEKSHFDLWEANRRILLSCGVLPANIEIFGACSYQKDNDFFSARRDGVETGRNVSGIMLLQP
ncbi:MAG: peptidoglycan editing factor PgeF [Prolixibacteraceae bacterium]